MNLDPLTEFVAVDSYLAAALDRGVRRYPGVLLGRVEPLLR